MNLAKMLPGRPPMRSVIPLLSTALHKACESAAFSYGLVLALQMKIIWQIWQYRDMTVGDTGYYFGDAYRWATTLETSIIWSPLYTSFYGTMFALTQDAYAATILHRAVIAVLAVIGVLAIARRMLPPALALLVAVWWALLPINFDVFYEVHLFALLFVLAAWLFALRSDTAASRGAALGMLAVTTVLVRNEYVIACLLYGLYCLWREIGAARPAGRGAGVAFRSVAPKYALPQVLAGLLCLFVFWRTPAPIEQLEAGFHGKHVVNMCQVYAFGYAQRHPEWTASPWIECQGLMKQVFGSNLPSLGEMAQSNFPALLDHFLWNLSLIPSGLQIGLFDAASGQVNPDYTPSQLGQSYPWWLSILALGIVAAGLSVALAHWRSLWSAQFRPIAYRWAPLLAVAAITVPVILTQRPRPEIIYGLTLVVMLVIGTSVHILTHRWRRATEIGAIAIAAAALLLIPSYYAEHPSERPAKSTYDRLVPYRDLLGTLPGDLILGNYAHETANWIGLPERRSKVKTYSALGPGWTPAVDLCSRTDCRAVSALYIHGYFMSQAMAAAADHALCPKDPDRRPWLAVGTATENKNGLLLIRETDDLVLPPKMTAVKCDTLQSPPPLPNTAALPPAGIASFPAGLMAPRLFFTGVSQDGWLGATAQTKLALPGPSNRLHLVGTFPGSSPNLASGTLKVIVDKVVVLEMPMTGGNIDREIEIPEAAGTRAIRFDMSATDQLPPPDGRIVSIQLGALSLEDHD